MPRNRLRVRDSALGNQGANIDASIFHRTDADVSIADKMQIDARRVASPKMSFESEEAAARFEGSPSPRWNHYPSRKTAAVTRGDLARVNCRDFKLLHKLRAKATS